MPLEITTSFPSLYCYTGQLCGATRGDETSERVRGSCLDWEVCEWFEETESEFQCRYSNGSWFEEGPPEMPCTDHRGGDFFCGGECGPCREYPDNMFLNATSCIGLSETNGFGFCMASANIGPWLCKEDTEPALWDFLANEWRIGGVEAPTQAACARLVQPGGCPVGC